MSPLEPRTISEELIDDVKGLIGQEILQRFINHPKMKHIPLIIEPPTLTNKELIEMLQNVKIWVD